MENTESADKNEMQCQMIQKLEGNITSVHNEGSCRPLSNVKSRNINSDASSPESELFDNVHDVKDVKTDTFGSDEKMGEFGNLMSSSQQENSDTSGVQAGLVKNLNENSIISSTSQDEFGDVGYKSPTEEDSKCKELELALHSEISDTEHKQNDLQEKLEGSMKLELHIEKIEEFHQVNSLEPVPVFNGTEVPGMEANTSPSTGSLDADQGVVEKAVALKNFVRKKSIGAVSTVLRRLSGKFDEGPLTTANDDLEHDSESPYASESKEVCQTPQDRSAWNPLSYIMPRGDANNAELRDSIIVEPPQPIVMRGRIILYTRLGCADCREARLFLHMKRLRYVEININVYPNRKLELEKFSGSSDVPKVFFNESLVGGLNQLKMLSESGKLDEKIEYLINEVPSLEAPLPPLSGEDDASSNGPVDELALIVRRMKEYVTVKDRFYKMRRFHNCFLGSEAIEFLSLDQYLEKEEAIEFGRKLASKLFFQHVLDEYDFEDGNHLYRFLDDDPIVASQCHNISRGITCLKPKAVTEIASRLRLLSNAIYEAYTSIDGRHVDYRSIHGSEEFARYLRIVEELQRVELQDMPREEKLPFFINLYNMMAIHGILVKGHPAGPLERRQLFSDFMYVIGGFTYSLSAIQNGILRGNQRPPYNLLKPFGAKDKRLKVALACPEPLIHFALVYGTRSGPALRCYSPGNIDKELTEAACNFLRSGGLILNLDARTALASKILKWFSMDFGSNELEILRHVSNYLDPADSATLLELLSSTKLEVTYQAYDWGLNN